MSGGTPTVSKRCPGRSTKRTRLPSASVSARIPACAGTSLGGQAAFGPANGLARGPPFAPCPCRWTFTMVASTMAYSRSGSSATASNKRGQTSAFTQSRKRAKTLFQCPNEGGRSRHGLPVRTIHSTASTNRRLSLPLRPGSPGLPSQSGSIFAHWASVKTKRSIQRLNHSQAWMRIPESQQAVAMRGVMGEKPVGFSRRSP